ncbi:MAG: DNA polymerase III subunit gamma/tau C-terminal domain-containing protein, partial [Psychrobium sp.]
ETAVDALKNKLMRLLDVPIELIVEIGDNEIQTPYQIAQDLHRERLSIAADRIKSDDGVLHFIDQFDANLVDESIKYRTLKAIS